MEAVLRVDRLGKRFRRHRASRSHSIAQAVMGGRRRSRIEEHFWVFREVSFEAHSGEMVGIIGRNGVGKSTLLSLMAGLMRADEGEIRVRGRVSALLDLGRSLHPLLTGWDNIRTYALLNGLTRRQVAERIDRIAEFTEIEGFLDAPVRTYSTGMKARLAFSVAIHVEPRILLIDEFLFVGDQFFQAKCLERIHQLMAAGTSVLLSSHIAEKISEHCHRALWLGNSGIRALGPPDEVMDQYQASTDSQEGARARSRP